MTEFLLGCWNRIKVRESGQREFSESASSIVSQQLGPLATVILLRRPVRREIGGDCGAVDS